MSARPLPCRLWIQMRCSPVTSMPLTDAGMAAIEGLDFSSGDNPRLRCAPTNILFDWYFEMDVNRIVQQTDTIEMFYGSMGIERTIYLDQAEHPAEIEPSVSGHSIGRWEDNVLIVDTVGFLPGILNADGRVPHSDQLRKVWNTIAFIMCLMRSTLWKKNLTRWAAGRLLRKEA